jgi:peptide/nickel transport system substrate-binding protein
MVYRLLPSRRDVLAYGLGAAALLFRNVQAQPSLASHLRIASSTVTRQLDPHALVFYQLRQVYDKLVTLDAETLEVIPELATGWTMVDPLTLELRLRENVVFSSGEPLTAATVVANIARVKTSLNPTLVRLQQLFTPVVRGEALDNLTLRVMTETPDPLLLRRMATLYILPNELLADDAALAATQSDGTGYFRVDEFIPGERIRLSRSPVGWRAQTQVETVEYRAYSDLGRLQSVLINGEADVAQGLPPQNARRLEGEFSLTSAPTFGCAICSLLADVEPKLGDRRVREALNLAVDKEAINNALQGGFGVVATGQLLQPGIPGYNPALEPFPYDPERARALLAEAGATDLALTIGTTPPFRLHAEMVALYLQGVGVRASVELVEFSQFVPALLVRSPYPMLYWDLYYSFLLDWEEASSRFAPTREGIQPHYLNEDFYALYQQAHLETDPDARAEMIGELAAMMREDAAVLFLTWSTLVYAHTPSILRLPINYDGSIRLWEVEKGQ